MLKRLLEDKFLLNEFQLTCVIWLMFRMDRCHIMIGCDINRWTYILHHCIDVKILLELISSLEVKSLAFVMVHGKSEKLC